MKLIVGLGNYGTEYRSTRHNLGFMVLDAVASQLDLLWPVTNSKFKATVVEHNENGEKIILAKPDTYMNLSGQAVGALVQFYKILPQDVWVLHDELDLTFGEMRIKQGGGDAGHNGLGSITAAIGPDYWRFRLGIAGPLLRHPIEPVDYVLQAFTAEEAAGLPRIAAAAATTITELITAHQAPSVGTSQLLG